MADYIFSLGLIPVQEFIAEARRSRDLRAGSAMLSWLMSKVLEKLEKEVEAKVIIPHPGALEPFKGKKFPEILKQVKYSIPNRASGYCTADSIEKLKSVFSALPEQCLQKSWNELFQDAFRHYNPFREIAGSEQHQQKLRNAFANSPDCPIQLIWVAREVQSGKNNARDLEDIRRLYDDIKRTRPILPWNGKPIPKCDQCGRREIFAPEDTFKKAWEWWQKQVKEHPSVKKGIRIEEGERLCLVCLAKRFAAYLDDSGKRFPSTSEVASRVWRSRIEKEPELAPLLNDLERETARLRGMSFEDPESLYYRRSLQKWGKPKKPEDDIEKQIGEIKKAKSALTQKLKTGSFEIKEEPSNYLAVLMFDGDNMGLKIAGKPEELPEKLHRFSAAIIAKYDEQNAGKSAQVFYIGGDEGLLLAPIETALQTAIEIRNLFAEVVGGDCTLSMGMAIFDRQRPLGGAIRLARRALETSKTLEDKNALTITIQTASGNEFSSTAHWGASWDRISNALQLIAGLSEKGKLSMGWAFEVENFLHSLPNPLPQRWGEPLFRKAVESEVRRITLRKLQIPSGAPAEKKTGRKDIWEDQLLGRQWFDDPAAGQGVARLSNQLHVIAFLCRESAYQAEYLSEQKEEGEIL